VDPAPVNVAAGAERSVFAYGSTVDAVVAEAGRLDPANARREPTAVIPAAVRLIHGERRCASFRSRILMVGGFLLMGM
jgi:hypothetical protein